MQMNNWNGRLAACTVLALFATSTYSFPASLSAQQPDATSPAVTFRKIMSAPAEFDDALWFWDLQSLKATGPKLAHDWCWDLGFSSDGKWLFARSHRQVKVRNGRSGEPVAGPFRHDLIEGGFAYDPRSQRLVTFENNSDEEASWSSAAVIRAGQDWSDTKRMNLSGHTRKARWIDDRHLLVISDVKQHF